MLFILGFDATGLIYLYRNKRSDSLHNRIILTLDRKEQSFMLEMKLHSFFYLLLWPLL